MLKFTHKIIRSDTAALTVTLPFETREKSRAQITLDDGTVAGFFLPRGQILRQGDHLQSEEGIIVTVIAAQESLSTVTCSDPLLLARICYHLGNRHVPLQITVQQICYQPDHVLDKMVEGFGLPVINQYLPFEPEVGAYGDTSHPASHSHA